jgi:hypothetical protein
MGWPPQPRELLPRAEEAYGIREKLARYSLNPSNKRGGPKARGFALILGVTIDSIDYVETQIRLEIQRYPIKTVSTIDHMDGAVWWNSLYEESGTTRVL